MSKPRAKSLTNAMNAYETSIPRIAIAALLVVAGIAWIGSSFYFIWLDNSLDAPEPGSDAAKKGVGGELWAVHGGGFYNPQKYLVAPGALPEKLHWFKWEAYTTWLSGFALMLVLYYLEASSALVKPGDDLDPWLAEKGITLPSADSEQGEER